MNCEISSDLLGWLQGGALFHILYYDVRTRESTYFAQA
jgi:hypothetical protein